MNIATRMLLVAVAATALPLQSAVANERFVVKAPAEYDANSRTRDGIRSECALEVLVANNVFAQIEQRFPGALLANGAPPAAQDKVVTLTILNATGHGGGSWSGPKALAVRADVMQDGKLVRSIVKSRNSRGGMFGGMMGTCGILERAASTVAKDIAVALERGDSGQRRSKAALDVPGEEDGEETAPTSAQPAARSPATPADTGPSAAAQRP